MTYQSTTEDAAPGGTGEAVCSASDAAQEVIYWAKAILTALNTGGIDKDSPIHHKLREVIIKHRDAVERETPNNKVSGPEPAAKGNHE